MLKEFKEEICPIELKKFKIINNGKNIINKIRKGYRNNINNPSLASRFESLVKKCG